MDILTIVGIVHYSHLNGYTLLLSLQIDNVIHKMRAVTIHVANKLFQTFLGMEHLGLLQVTLIVRTLVSERNGDAGIQVSQLTHTTGNDIVLIFCSSKDTSVRPELLTCTSNVGIADYLHIVKGFTLLVFLLVDMSVAEHL